MKSKFKLFMCILTLIIMLFLSSCSLNSPPKLKVSSEEIKFDVSAGTYSWGNVEADGIKNLNDVIKNKDILSMESGAKLKIKFSRKPDSFVVTARDDIDRYPVKRTDNEITIPYTNGIILFEVHGKWSKGDAYYLFAINVNYEYEYTDDFNFRLNFNTYGKNQIDTYKNTFTKDLVVDGTKTIDFSLPEMEMRKILVLMSNIDILSFPDTLENEDFFVTPPCDYKLKVSINGLDKEIIWNGGAYVSMKDNSKLTEEQKAFLELVEYIQDYIYNTDEYRELPKPKWGYE